MEFFENIIPNAIAFFLPFLVGSLFFFSIVIAPNVFKNLDQKNARKFIRSIFPKLYFWSFIISFALALLVYTKSFLLGSILLCVSLAFLFSRQYLTPWINEVSDQVNKDEKQKKKFLILHTFSVVIFIVQVFLLTTIYFKI